MNDFKTIEILGTRYWTAKETSRLLCLSNASIHNLIKRKSLTAIRIGAKVLISEPSLARFLLKAGIVLNGQSSSRGST